MEKVNYKHVNIPRELSELIGHMHDVEGYREELRTLVGQWDLLTILGQMSGTSSDMSATQQEFQSLTDELLGQLGLETLKKTSQEMGAMAQVAVDILIRNLFERTADIGFLATDDDIRKFLIGYEEGNGDSGETALVTRFKEYVAKYSVYYNIVLMDTAGRVVAQLDQDSDVTRSTDPVIVEALTTDAEYVEVFRHSDLDAANAQSLIYAYRVTRSNNDDTPIGVLCLFFRFDNEMEGIFANLISSDDWSVVSILDADGRVIASSDPYQVPKGVQLERVLDAPYKIVRYAGREYLSKTCATKGYQGFFGMGWQGHVMLPLDHAFAATAHSDLAARISNDVLDNVMQDPRLFSEALRQIPVQADTIQKRLERTVWNGNVHENTSQSKVLLWNISAAGERTKKVFESSIGNLHETVVSTILDDVSFMAALAVDIMDRNLYERANDCRWWALTSAFRSILSQDSVSDADAQTVCAILKYINDLYTVYTNLIVYNAKGEVVGVSDPAEMRLQGKPLSAPWIKDTLVLQDSQAYGVSAFAPSSLYGGKHTYIYGASIAAPDAADQIVGGIGIVFDSEPQFRAMLTDCLPQDNRGVVREGFFAVLCDREGRIVSSTSPDLAVGTMLDVDKDLFALENAHQDARIISFDSQYYALGSCTSSGYREYKRKDHYTNDVIALVFAPLASVQAQTSTEVQTRVEANFEFDMVSGQEFIEVASVLIAGRTYAFRTSAVDKAIDIDGLTEIPGAHSLLCGKILDDDKAVPVIDFAMLSKGRSTPCNDSSQIVLLSGSRGRFGIIVDALGPIPNVPTDKIDFNASFLDSADKYTEGVMLPPSSDGKSELVVLLDVDRLQDHLWSMGTFKKNAASVAATPIKPSRRDSVSA